MARTAARKRPAESESGSEQEESEDDQPISKAAARAGVKAKTGGARKSNASAASQKKAPAKKGGKKAPAPTQDDDESEIDEDDESDGEATGKGAKGKDLTEDEKKKIVKQLVRFLLFQGSTGDGKPFGRNDVVKGPLKGQGKHYTDMIRKANKILMNDFGLMVQELRAKETGSKSKAFIVRSTLPQSVLAAMHTIESPDLFEKFDDDDVGSAQFVKQTLEWNSTDRGTLRETEKGEAGSLATTGLLFTVLSLILVNGKLLTDDQLFQYMKRFGLQPDSILPVTLSNAHKETTLTQTLTQFTRQGYLERSKSAAAPRDGEGQKYEWRWGPRANAEIGELAMAGFIQATYESKEANPNQEEGEEGGTRRRGRTGAKLITEIARAAGEGKLQDADADNKKTKNKDKEAEGGGGDDDE